LQVIGGNDGVGRRTCPDGTEQACDCTVVAGIVVVSDVEVLEVSSRSCWNLVVLAGGDWIAGVLRG
jgi:hypothetical protein